MANGLTEGLELRRMGSGVVILTAGAALSLVAIIMTARVGMSEWSYAVIFGLLIAVGEMVQFNVDRSRNRAPIATSAALGYAMLRGPSVGVPPDVAQVVTVVGISTMLGVTPRAIAGLRWDAVVSCRRVLSVACAAAVFSAVTTDHHSW